MDDAVAELVGMLPEGVVVTAPDALEKYRFDWTHDATAGTPLAAVRAETADHVQVTMRWASAHGIPVVPRGAGSGLSGGALAVDGGIVLSTERMRAVEIDTASRVAVVEPGALNVEVKRAAAAEGLWYPPDPSSYEICSIGGNIATNAGGLCCVKYGVTTDYVLGLDVVLADGTLRHPRRQAGQGRRGAAAAQALRRVRGHPRRRHPGDPAAGARPGPRVDGRRHLPDRRRARPPPSSSSAARCAPRWSS